MIEPLPRSFPVSSSYTTRLPTMQDTAKLNHSPSVSFRLLNLKHCSSRVAEQVEMNLAAGNSILAIHNHPHGEQPIRARWRRAAESRPSCVA